MPHWCLHPGCLESLESFDSPAAVAAHMREAHDCGGDDADGATSSSKRLCLILDIDGTLLSDDCEDVLPVIALRDLLRRPAANVFENGIELELLN